MSSTYLYADNDTTYDMSVSSTGTVLSYTDITTRVPLPSIQANANKYLKVRNDGLNLEWDDVVLSGGIDLILDERTASNPPSILFEDSNGTEYNTGINMYRDTTNANNQTISLYANNVKKMDVAENRVVIGTVANPVPLIINGSISLEAITLTNTPNNYQWNSLTSDSYILDTSSGILNILLNSSGTANIGRTIRFYKSSISNLVQFFASGGVSRLSGDFGSAASNNALINGTPNNVNRLWLFEITRDTASTYTLHSIALHNNTNAFTHSDIVNANIFRAGDGTISIPSYSFNTDTDTGMYMEISGNRRVRFPVDGVDRLILSNSGTASIPGRLTLDAGSVSAPSLFFDTATGLYRPTTNQLAISTNSVLNTNFTTTGVDIGTVANPRDLNIVGNIRNSLGTVSLPSYSFTGDTNTGMYSATADTINFATNATQRMRIDNTGVTISSTFNPTRIIQYGVAALQSASFNIATNVNEHIVPVNSSSGNLIITLSNVVAGAHFMIYKENTANEVQITNLSGDTYNGATRTAFAVIPNGNRGVINLYQLTSTAWFGAVTQF